MAETTQSPYGGFSLIYNKGRDFVADLIVQSVIINLLMLTGPIFMMLVYDSVMSSRSVQTLAGLVILIAVLYAIMGLIDFVRARLIAIMGRRRVAYYEPFVFDAQTDPRIMPAKALSLLKSLDSYSQIYQTPALMGYFDVIWIPIFIGVLFFLHFWLGIAGVGGCALMVIFALFQKGAARKSREAFAQLHQNAFDFAIETAKGRELIYAQAMTENFKGKWSTLRLQAADRINQTERVSGFFTSLSKSTRLLIQSLMLGLGALLAINDMISPGAIIGGSILLGRALAPLDQILGSWTQVQQAVSAQNALEALLDETPDAKPPVSYPELNAHFQATGLAVLGDNRKPIIQGVSVELKPGEVLGVIGPSGSGKSTFARAILGLVPLASGEVTLGGVNKDHLGQEVYGQNIGYLPQDVQLFSGTISENIARMSDGYDDADVLAAARAAHIEDLINELDDGFLTMIKPESNLFSGGQKQRLALARALYKKPKLLILDEPNSALDDMGTRALNAAIMGAKKSGRCVILMTHRPNAIQMVDKIMVIQNGRMRDYGPKDEVIARSTKNTEGPNQ